MARRRLAASALASALALGCGARDQPAIPPAADGWRSNTGDEALGEAEPTSVDVADFIRQTYEKQQVLIPMRDGVRLHTTIYVPRDLTGEIPIMLFRTPYGTGPYGEQEMPEKLGPSKTLLLEGWIFAYQDVRGRYMSEGTFVNMTPHLPKKSGDGEIDESTDTYDTIEWLLANLEGHNGRVGQWGISYPGFYAAAGMIDAHPALRAVSPQAPIADWYFDDFHHHGAFFLPHAFNFFASFGRPREGPTTERPPRFDHGTPDGYQFFLELGPLRNVNERYFHGEVAFWNDLVAHPHYDDFWSARNLLPHLRRVAPAVMTVGGWFDAEDLYGALHVYQAIEEQNPQVFNVMVMGPWRHGGWARDSGRRLGEVDFGSETSTFYQESIEAPFFQHFLADGPPPDMPEAWVFETGANRWRRFEDWPPPGTKTHRLFARAGGALSTVAPTASRGFDAWRSDPEQPVPFTAAIATGMTREYMIEDQRFAARRPDVVAYATEPLEAPLTVAGEVTARLWVSTSGSDSDWVVKLIDVFPGDAVMPAEGPGAEPLPFGGTQMMVRSEVMRGRYRNGYERPEPMRPGAPTLVEVPLQAVLHTFEKGHRIMIQVQSTWFPMVDLNPHRFVENPFFADEDDFIPADQRLYYSRHHPTTFDLPILQSRSSGSARNGS